MYLLRPGFLCIEGAPLGFGGDLVVYKLRNEYKVGAGHIDTNVICLIYFNVLPPFRGILIFLIPDEPKR